jgi:hypothetical protein
LFRSTFVVKIEKKGRNPLHRAKKNNEDKENILLLPGPADSGRLSGPGGLLLDTGKEGTSSMGGEGGRGA